MGFLSRHLRVFVLERFLRLMPVLVPFLGRRRSCPRVEVPLVPVSWPVSFESQCSVLVVLACLLGGLSRRVLVLSRCLLDESCRLSPGGCRGAVGLRYAQESASVVFLGPASLGSCYVISGAHVSRGALSLDWDLFYTNRFRSRLGGGCFSFLTGAYGASCVPVGCVCFGGEVSLFVVGGA